jgi:hypothetical protein
LVGVRCAPTLFEPGLDLGEIPHDAAFGNEKAAWKFSALLQFVDR